MGNKTDKINYVGDTHMVMMGRVTPQLIMRTSGDVVYTDTINIVEVGSAGITQAVDRVGADYENVGLISMDGLFCPYYIGQSGNTHDTLPVWSDPDPAFSGVVNSKKLNPFNPDGLLPNALAFYESGHNILLTNTLSSSGDTNFGDLNPYKDIAERDSIVNSGHKSVGFRGPMVLTGPGYDIDGFPVPAIGDSYHPDAFRDPSLWKSGPVDHRWDEERGVWGGPTPFYLIKFTNVYNPSCFSYEVDRATTRAQYTRNAPSGEIDPTGTIYDPEHVAYHNNPNNSGCYEYLNFSGLGFPSYEAFIIRRTHDETSTMNDYNLWYDDVSDCGHVTNPCPSGNTRGTHGSASTRKKILVENPLRQSFSVGDLAISINTGRMKKVASSSFIGGSGTGAAGNFSTNGAGNLSFNITSSGSGYTAGAFAIYNYPNVGLSLSTSSGVVSGSSISGGTTGYPPNKTYSVAIYPRNATAGYEYLPIHWVLQAEFKSQQFVTHVECDNGILQTCTVKGQLQGFLSCEHCGENSALVNNFI
jgi:hypothetical protein